MPIEFACARCHTKYQVKEALAGKSAKCSKCGEKVRIPAPAAAQAAAPGPQALAPKPHHRPQTVQPAKLSATPPPASWLDEELEVEQPVAVHRSTNGKACPGCGAPLERSAVLCIKCGYDTRCGEKLVTRHVTEADDDRAERPAASSLGMAGSLLRGTFFSFIAALLGAFVWAALAYLTMHEFAIVAWALGGLVGFGMALGHDDDDGSWAGMIAAFMSLFGIVAAKVMIIIIFVGAAVASGEIDLEVGDPQLGGVQIDEVELRRTIVAAAIAGEKLEAQGLDPEQVTEEVWDKAFAEAQTEVAGLSERELQARMVQLDEEEEADFAADKQLPGEAAAEEGLAAAEPEHQPAEPPAVVEADEEAGLVSLFFSEMFQPIDGLFILLAFFTAYKVGSGMMTD